MLEREKTDHTAALLSCCPTGCILATGEKVRLPFNPSYRMREAPKVHLERQKAIWRAVGGPARQVPRSWKET